MLFDNLKRTVEYGGVFQMNDAAARAGLQVPLYYLAVRVIVRAKVIADGLFLNVEFFGDAVDAASGQGVLDAAQLLEGDVHKPQFW